MLYDILFYYEKQNIPGLLLLNDFAAAFLHCFLEIYA